MRVALLLLLLTVSCKQRELSVDTTYFTRKDLASVVVDTPDPDKEKPIFGQRLYINWEVTKQQFAMGPLELHIQLMLKKGSMMEDRIPLNEASGTYIFPIVSSDYTKEGGLLSYKITLLSNGKELAVTRHKFWVDQIEFSE